MSLELFVRGIYTHTAVARHPCFSWAFLYVHVLVVLTKAHSIRQRQRLTNAPYTVYDFCVTAIALRRALVMTLSCYGALEIVCVLSLYNP